MFLSLYNDEIKQQDTSVQIYSYKYEFERQYSKIELIRVHREKIVSHLPLFNKLPHAVIVLSTFKTILANVRFLNIYISLQDTHTERV